MEYGRSTFGADLREFNLWWVSKVKTDLLRKIVRPEEITKSRRRLGRYRRKAGLSLSDRRPDLEASLQGYGTLLFETSFGFHKKFVPDPGRKISETGNFLILWHVGRESQTYGTIKCGGRTYDSISYYYSLATVVSLIEEAERRGDKVSLLVSPRDVEKTLSVGRDEDFLSVRTERNFQFLKADGKIAFEENPFEDLMNRYLTGPFGRSLVGEPPESIQGLIRQAEQEMWSNILNPLDIEYPKWAKKRGDMIIEKYFPNAHRREYPNAEPAEVSRVLFYERSTEYEEMKEKLLGVAPNSSIQPSLERPIGFVFDVFSKMVHDRRGTMVVITTLFEPVSIYVTRHYLKAIHRNMDILIVDFGPADLAPLFSMPEMMVNGRPIVKYAWIGPNVTEITERVLRAIGGSLEGVPVN